MAYLKFKKRQPLEVWPNPASDAIWISNENPEDVELSIFDIRGKMMIQTKLRMGNQQIDLSGLSAGMYLLITDEKQAKSW